MNKKETKKIAEAITGKKVEGKKKCLPEQCQDCPAKDLCNGEPEETLDKMLKNSSFEVVKEEDLPDEIKKFVSDVKGLGLGIKVEAREIKIDEAPKKYCQHCGQALIERDVPAERYNILLERPPFHSYAPNKAYDEKTGKKLFVKEYICPSRGNIFGQKHDRYSIGKAFTK